MIDITYICPVCGSEMIIPVDNRLKRNKDDGQYAWKLIVCEKISGNVYRCEITKKCESCWHNIKASVEIELM